MRPCGNYNLKVYIYYWDENQSNWIWIWNQSKTFFISEIDDDENITERDNDTTQEASIDENVDNEEDEVVKAIKFEKSKPRDHPPTILCDDFVVNISFHPSKNLIALGNICGDVLFYEYSNDETKLTNTLELHLNAIRDIEFDDDGTTIFSTAKVS